jgi:site-specific DNA-methyltransferase (adenine-specific)
MKKEKLMLGDNIESLKKLPENSIDSVVTDGPYGLSFMNKKWDYDVPSVDFWKEVYRVLKPGGHLLSFGGTRTYHRMVVNIEDAGFEIRDQIQWLYAQGFPKSLNVGKAVDKLEGNEREYVKESENNRTGRTSDWSKEYNIRPYPPITKGQSDWEGWGSALKPANEPICLARKPLSEKSIAENVLKWRTGGINVDGCRIGIDGKDDRSVGKRTCNIFDEVKVSGGIDSLEYIPDENGRFPANLILDESAAEMLDEQSGNTKSSKRNPNHNKKTEYTNTYTPANAEYRDDNTYGDSGGVSRFFYVAKVSKAERNMGLDEFEDKVIEGRDVGQDERSVAYKKRPTPTKNTHPTVKPVNLMSYLCKLITPPNGIVLDPFMGSGSTGIAALLNDFRFVGMEMDNDYFKIAEARINSYEEYRKFLRK